MSSVGWQRWVSSTDLGTYRCQISFSTPSQSHSKSNKRMSEGGSWGSSNFVLTEKNSVDTDAKSRWLLHGPAVCTQLSSWGRDTHFGSVLHNAAATSAGTPTQYGIITGIIFCSCVHTLYIQVFFLPGTVHYMRLKMVWKQNLCLFLCFLTVVKDTLLNSCSTSHTTCTNS